MGNDLIQFRDVICRVSRAKIKADPPIRLGFLCNVDGPLWVKNGPDAVEMGCLYYPPKADIGQPRCRLRRHRLLRWSEAGHHRSTLAVQNPWLAIGRAS
jgi:hypothetical protein